MRNTSVRRTIPDIVRPVLRTAGRLRRQGKLSVETFAAQVARLSREELEPRGLELIMDEDGQGWLRFSIKQRNDGVLRELILCADEEEPREVPLAEREHGVRLPATLQGTCG